jgi:2-polyprenyl-6-methoxyphenol hydroxylase-like FAD-dependent oxidoreductase
MRIMILGGGQVGTLVARRLVRERNEVVIVETNEERCAQLEAALDIKVIRGSATSIEFLKQAGLPAENPVRWVGGRSQPAGTEDSARSSAALRSGIAFRDAAAGNSAGSGARP